MPLIVRMSGQFRGCHSHINLYSHLILWLVNFHSGCIGCEHSHAFILMLALVWMTLYSVSQEERAKLREGVPYVKLYRYNPKHLYPKLNSYGDNGQRKVWTSCISAFYTPTAVSRATPPSRSSDCVQSVRWLVLRRTSSTQRDKTVLHC